MKIQMKKETVDNVEQLQLHGSVGVQSATKIKAFLLEALQAGTEKELVLAQATAVDVAGTQLILAWKRQLSQNGISARVLPPADENVKSLLDKSGITKIF